MSKKILCIEDNTTNMILISRIVEAEGHELIRAEDGHRAMELLSDFVPDIILLDINIPGVSGLDLAQKIREDGRLSGIPILAVTANVLVGDREKCLEAGCDDYLPKPLDIRRLRQLMRLYLGDSRQLR
jgi:two-component system, cell cycle response regulator DivK